MSLGRAPAAEKDAPPSANAEPAAAAFDGPQGYERFRAEAVIPQVFDVSTDAHGFRARLSPSPLGAAMLIGYEMTAARYRRSAERARRDGVDHVWVQLIEAGGLLGWSPDRQVALAPASVGFCDFGVATEQSSLASSGMALLIPRDAFSRTDTAGLHGGAARGARFELLSDHVAWLRAAAPGASAPAVSRAATALAAVVAACLSPGLRPPEEATDALGAAALRRIRAYMVEHLGRPGLDAAQVARAVGVSRSTLYRLCAPEGGAAEMMWSIRLDAARRALTDPTHPGRIGDIAEAAGFSSLSHFSRRFRDRYGFSPRNLRPF